MKTKTIANFWNDFSSHTLKGLPTTNPIYGYFKMVYYKAIMDILAHQHNVIGSVEISEEEGAAAFQGWVDEIDSFLGKMPMAKKL